MAFDGAQRPGTTLNRMNVGDFRREIPISDHRTVRVIIDSVSSRPEVERAALIQVIAQDERGLRIPLDKWTRMSARVDEYFYLEDGDPASPATTDVRITVPKGTVKLVLIGHRWRSKAKTVLVGEPIVHLIGGPEPLPMTSPSGATLEWSGTDIHYEFPIPVGSGKVSGALYARSTNSGSSPMAIRLLDSEDQDILPPEDLPINPRFGTYVDMSVTPEQTRNDFSFRVPRSAAKVIIAGVDWPVREAVLAGPPQVWFERDESLDALKDFLKVNADRPLMVIDTTAPPLGHETLALRPNNLALEYAELGYTVIFVPFGSTQDHPWILSEHLAQVPRDLSDELIEHIIETPAEAPRTYICSSFPSLENNARSENLKRHGWTTVYEVRDDMEEFNRVGYSKWYHTLLEARMAEHTDLVVTVSDALAHKIQAMTNHPVVTHVVPNGVKRTTLEGSVGLRSAAAIEAHEAGGVIGYVGHLTPSWFDWNAVIHAAHEMPQASFEIVGHGKPEHLELPENIHYHGAKTHDELLSIVRRWKIALIPFIDSPLTRGVDPNKIYEYFAWGLRVVSARMGAVHRYPSTRVYSGGDGLVAALQEMTATPVSEAEMAAISDFAAQSSWHRRAVTMAELIEGARA